MNGTAQDVGGECKDCFVHVDNIASHRDAVHGREPLFECSACGFLFWTKERLANHVDAVHAIRHPACNICNSSFSSRAELDSHIRTKHRDGQMICCRVCSMPCSGIKGIRDHMAEEHADDWLVCVKCVEAAPSGAPVVYYSSNEALQAHILVKHVEKSLYCQECGLVSATKEENRWHRSRAHPTVYPFRCESCGLRFRKPEALGWHLEESPGCMNRKPRVAKPELLTSDAGCKEDTMVVDEGGNGKRVTGHKLGGKYACPDCPRTFGTRKAVARHNEAVHAVSRCQFCGETFGTDSWKRCHERQCKVKVLIGCPFRFPEYVTP